jgi:transposase
MAQHLLRLGSRPRAHGRAVLFAQLSCPPAVHQEVGDGGRLDALRASVVNRMQKVLEGANLKLSMVVTDITGVSARAMLQALVAGQADPHILADLARGQLRKKRDALAQALAGQFRDHHRFLLTQHLLHLEFLEEQIATFDQQIAARREQYQAPTQPDGQAARADAEAKQPTGEL